MNDPDPTMSLTRVAPMSAPARTLLAAWHASDSIDLTVRVQ